MEAKLEVKCILSIVGNARKILILQRKSIQIVWILIEFGYISDINLLFITVV